MKSMSLRFCRRSASGYTLTELVFVMGILIIMAAIAVPHLQHLKRSLVSKKAAREVVGALRATRSLAIMTNREHRIDFEPQLKRYRIMKGNQPNNSIAWTPTTEEWTEIEGETIFMSSTIDAIHFNPNGSSNLGTITISDSATNLNYRVIVTRTGRVRIS